MKASIMFLLGAGISIPAGFPNTRDITSQIISGTNIIRHTDSRYYLSSNPSPLETYETSRYLPKVKNLIEVINEIMSDYDKREFINYEILYYFVQQLYDFESGNYFNMALYPFVKEVKIRMNHIDLDQYIFVFSETEKYIRHSVWRALQHHPTYTSYLGFLTTAFSDKDLIHVNLTTLNHDLLIENVLNSKSIALNDGFTSPVNNVKYWNGKFSTTRNFLKLHGSINWFNLRPDNATWFEDRVGIVLNGDIDHARTSKNRLMKSLPNKEPLILIGTYNKVYEYSESVFNDLYSQFRKLLSKSNYLIITGYSFGDKGVNNAILEWLYQKKTHKVIIIHPNPQRLIKEQARLAIKKAYSNLSSNSFKIIPKKVEQVTWGEIKNTL